ncbi:MAG: Rrf2 family transcriptional regulator [Formivibrio sp.]|nr:Rrf2 family transcriptional regulator [Formivibrio sp.]
MKLLASTDFALRTLMVLTNEPPGRPLNVEAMAYKLGGLSRNHLHKIVQELASLGLVHTIRGAGGGMTLAVAPKKIRVGTLIRQLEGDQPVVECFRNDGGCCTLAAGCQLRGFIRIARESFYRSLDAHTLADCFQGDIQLS